MLAIGPATRSQLYEVLGWLEREEIESGEGFYCKRDLIEQSFNDGDMNCATFGSEVVGFVIHTIKSHGAALDIMAIHPAHRRRGFGRELALYAIDKLFQLGADFVTVRCAPRSSETFWRCLGFAPLTRSFSRFSDTAMLVLHQSGVPFSPQDG